MKNTVFDFSETGLTIIQVLSENSHCIKNNFLWILIKPRKSFRKTASVFGATQRQVILDQHFRITFLDQYELRCSREATISIN